MMLRSWENQAKTVEARHGRVEEELWHAVGKMKNGKAGGESGILPEMVKAACCEPDFHV